MARQERLRKLRALLSAEKDKEKEIALFEDFQREEYTHRLIIQRENSRPQRPVKTLKQMLNCVSFRRQEILNDDGEVQTLVEGEDSNFMVNFRNMCAKLKQEQEAAKIENAFIVPKTEFQSIEILK